LFHAHNSVGRSADLRVLCHRIVLGHAGPSAQWTWVIPRGNQRRGQYRARCTNKHACPPQTSTGAGAAPYTLQTYWEQGTTTPTTSLPRFNCTNGDRRSSPSAPCTSTTTASGVEVADVWGKPFRPQHSTSQRALAAPTSTHTSAFKNPGSTTADVSLTYMRGNGHNTANQVIVPPHSRSTSYQVQRWHWERRRPRLLHGGCLHQRDRRSSPSAPCTSTTRFQ